MWGGALPAVRHGGISKKAKKAKKDNFFEKLTVQELKELLRASQQPVSGNHAALVERLLADARTSQYGAEARASVVYRTADFDIGFTAAKEGWSVQSLKSACLSKGLVQSGSKYELVLRLLQEQSGVGEPKRAAVEHDPTGRALVDPTTGAPVLKVRKPSTKAPDLAKVTARVERKAYPSDAVMNKWSNYKSKQHMSEVISLARGLIRSEATDKGFTEKDPAFAAQIAEAALAPVIGNGDFIRGWGYADFEAQQLTGDLRVIFSAARDVVSDATRQRHCAWITELAMEASRYGIDCLGALPALLQ
mmetsp:Transcript_20864/g.42697  ORF Transcript_20864/g.42697 Transcript_20864/m.42697 type:complete len:305 (+) Transcript_20864:37-951(+)